jgi:hypothetical protein
MASTSSSAAVAAMVQRASQQYLECRRGVTAKVDEVKQLDEQIGAVFAQISALSEAPEGQEELSEQAKAAAKSVGRLEVTLAGVEGEEPVAGAAITVALDPEYEADEYETVEEVVEKKDVVVTDENGNVVEEGQLPEEDGESTPRKLKTTTKITRTIIKKKVKKEKKPVVRTVAWTAKAEEEGEEQEQGEKPLSFPATFVFDPVQSREAVVIVTVAAAETEDEEEPEPIREIEFPISSLFQDNALDKLWRRPLRRLWRRPLRRKLLPRRPRRLRKRLRRPRKRPRRPRRPRRLRRRPPRLRRSRRPRRSRRRRPQRWSRSLRRRLRRPRWQRSRWRSPSRLALAST